MTGDFIRPIKGELTELKRIELRIEQVLLAKAGLHPHLPSQIKEADTRILADERRQLFSFDVLLRARLSCEADDTAGTSGWLDYSNGLGVTLRRWERNQARDEWLARFHALFPKVAL